MNRLVDTLTGGAKGCPRGNCDQGDTCDCYSDEVLDAQAPSPCDPSETPEEPPFKWPAVFVVAAVSFVALVGWAGWVAWRLA